MFNQPVRGGCGGAQPGSKISHLCTNKPRWPPSAGKAFRGNLFFKTHMLTLVVKEHICMKLHFFFFSFYACVRVCVWVCTSHLLCLHVADFFFSLLFLPGRDKCNSWVWEFNWLKKIFFKKRTQRSEMQLSWPWQVEKQIYLSSALVQSLNLWDLWLPIHNQELFGHECYFSFGCCFFFFSPEALWRNYHARLPGIWHLHFPHLHEPPSCLAKCVYAK